ncbi:MAG: hypothetical protein ACKOCM_00545 [Cyanobacteriota bacterium]
MQARIRALSSRQQSRSPLCAVTTPERILVFFPLHTSVDDHHQESLRRIAADFATTPEGRRDLTSGMHKALALRDSFWSWLLERARRVPTWKDDDAS